MSAPNSSHQWFPRVLLLPDAVFSRALPPLCDAFHWLESSSKYQSGMGKREDMDRYSGGADDGGARAVRSRRGSGIGLSGCCMLSCLGVVSKAWRLRLVTIVIKRLMLYNTGCMHRA